MLNDFSKAEQSGWLEPMLKAIAEAAPILATRKDAAFASKVGLLTAPPPPPKPERRPKPEPAKKEAADGL